MLLSCCVIVCFSYIICSLTVLASSLYVISWPVTPCLLFPHQFLRQQSGSALFWGKMTAAHLHRNSSPNSTSFFPSTVKRWSGRKRPGKVYRPSRNILNRRFRLNKNAFWFHRSSQFILHYILSMATRDATLVNVNCLLLLFWKRIFFLAYYPSIPICTLHTQIKNTISNCIDIV